MPEEELEMRSLKEGRAITKAMEATNEKVMKICIIQKKEQQLKINKLWDTNKVIHGVGAQWLPPKAQIIYISGKYRLFAHSTIWSEWKGKVKPSISQDC